MHQMMAVKSLEVKFLKEIEQHKGVVFKIAKMYMDAREDQQDLFQEITYQAWKAYPNFRGESKFSTWLYRVALNTAIVFLKSEKKRSVFSTLETENMPARAEEYDELQDVRLNHMYAAIHQLNPIEKALIFYYLEDYSGKEMAAQLGISEGNCRVKLNRAKEKLRELVIIF